ncbi:MAG: hypothetical protein R2856_34730 [Caldilineaceae bacterium]
MYAFKGRLVSAERLASEACRIEIDICGKPIGKQDQYLAAYGGFKYMQFLPDEHVDVQPVLCNGALTRQLEANLLLLYTGLTRSADGILAQQSHNTKTGNGARDSLRRMVQLAETLRGDLANERTDCFGHYLHEGWIQKRSLANGVSNKRLDDWYDTARRHGARRRQDPRRRRRRLCWWTRRPNIMEPSSRPCPN